MYVDVFSSRSGADGAMKTPLIKSVLVTTVISYVTLIMMVSGASA